MSQATNRTAPDSNSDMGRAAGAAQPFAGLIDPILVDDPVAFPFAGSVARSHAAAAWTWVLRDLCPDLISADGVAKGHVGAAELELIMPELLARMKDDEKVQARTLAHAVFAPGANIRRPSCIVFTS